MARKDIIRPLRFGRRARHAWTPVTDPAPVNRMRTALVRFNAADALLTRCGGVRRMETVLAANTPADLLAAYAADVAATRRDSLSPLAAGPDGALLDFRVPGWNASLQWPESKPVFAITLTSDGGVRVRDHHTVGPRVVRRWAAEALALAAVLDGVAVIEAEDSGPPTSEDRADAQHLLRSLGLSEQDAEQAIDSSARSLLEPMA